MIRRLLWSLYTLPMTLFFAVPAIADVEFAGIVAVLDLALMLPLFVAVQLHIWDRRSLSGNTWRVYAFCVLVWQVAYRFFLYPAATGVPASIWTAIEIVFLAPLLIALFRYAYRTWDLSADGGVTAVTSGASDAARSRVRLVVLSLVAVLLGGCALTGYGMTYLGNHPELSLTRLLPERALYEVETPPPAEPYDATTRPRFAEEDYARLRQLFEARDFDALDAELVAMQAAFEADRAQEYVITDALTAFTLPQDEEILDDWVEHDQAGWPAREARSQFYYERGWEARGSGWASETSDEQFASMGDYFEAALADGDRVLSTNELVLVAHTTRIAIANANGTARDEFLLFDEAAELFPDSFMLYRRMMNSQLPRWGGSYEQMEETAQMALAANPDDPRMYVLLGSIYEDQADILAADGLPEQAYDAYTTALSYGDSAYCYIGRADALRELGELEAALEDADRAVALSPHNVDALLARASVLADMGHEAQALTMIETAERYAPNDTRVVSWSEWADEHVR